MINLWNSNFQYVVPLFFVSCMFHPLLLQMFSAAYSSFLTHFLQALCLQLQCLRFLKKQI